MFLLHQNCRPVGQSSFKVTEKPVTFIAILGFFIFFIYSLHYSFIFFHFLLPPFLTLILLFFLSKIQRKLAVVFLKNNLRANFRNILHSFFEKYFDQNDHSSVLIVVILAQIFLHKSMDWFLYDNGLRHEKVKCTCSSLFMSGFLDIGAGAKVTIEQQKKSISFEKS